jgi:LysM repeat protein
MQWKRLAYYLLINVAVSAITMLVVLSLWDRSHQPAVENVTPVAQLPTPLPTSPPVSPTLPPSPTPDYLIHRVESGETLGQIATAYDLTIEDLLAVNNLEDPNRLEIGQVIYIPPEGGIEIDQAVVEETQVVATEVSATDDQIAIEAGAEIEIVAIVGVGDLASERVQLGDLTGEKHDLEGWYLEDEDGNRYEFPDFTLYAGGEIRVNTRSGNDSTINLYWGLDEPVWEPGEFATLYDPDGNSQAAYQVP